jgi:hypothetical protein
VRSGIAQDWFGHVDLDDAGNTLAAWHRASSAAGVTEIYNHTSSSHVYADVEGRIADRHPHLHA